MENKLGVFSKSVLSELVYKFKKYNKKRECVKQEFRAHVKNWLIQKLLLFWSRKLSNRKNTTGKCWADEALKTSPPPWAFRSLTGLESA
jgi:hypothetical protein